MQQRLTMRAVATTLITLVNISTSTADGIVTAST